MAKYSIFTMIISLRKLIAIAEKWEKMIGIPRRTRISLPAYKISGNDNKVASKGHFVVYSTDKRRFVVPLAYLSTNIFRELFRMSEEEFGLPRDGPITLPFDAAFLVYVVSMVQRLSLFSYEKLDKALLLALASGL